MSFRKRLIRLKPNIQYTIYHILRGIHLRTWVALGIILVLLPVIIFRVIYNAAAAPPVANTRWTLDDAQGTTVQDYTTNDNDGVITGATWIETDRCIDGNCLQFDGADDRVSRADDADFDFAAADSFTFSLWFRHAPKTATVEYIFNKFLDNAQTEGGYRMQMEADGDITCSIDDDNDTFPDDSATSTAATYDDNNWHHVACVKNGTTSLTLYIDGQQVAQDATIAATGTLANDDAFYLGADDGGLTNEFTGFIDEFRLYRSALTAAEILVDFNFGAAARFKDTPSDFLTEDLVGYWKADETSGNMSDSSGNATTLTDTNTVTFVGGKFGNAGDFESTASEYQFAADNAALSTTGSLTLAAWIRPESVSAGSYNIIAKWDGSNESYRLFQNGDEIRLELDSANNYQETSAYNLAASTWYHVVGVYNSNSQTAKIYINGAEATSTTTGTIPSSIGDDAGRFHLGAEDSTGGATGYYDGYIDEARIYNRALSPAEVRSLYNWAPGPIGHWKMDEGSWNNDCSTDTVFDSSGNGFNGDSCPSSTGPTTPETGKYGKALHADGSNDEFNVADNASLDITGDISFSGWIKKDTNPSGDMGFMSKDDGSSFNYFFGVRGTGAGGDANKIWYYDTSSGGTVSTRTVTDTNWHHIGITRSGTTVNFYIDGVLDRTVTVAGTPTANAAVLTIANRDDGTFTFDGYLDDIRLYNYARTAQQIVEDMNAGHPTGGSPLGTATSYWKFDEGYGTTAFDDNDANSNDLTLSAASWTLSGKFDKAWNGTGSVWLTRADDDDFDFAAADDFTISLWFKSDSATNPSTATQYLFEKGTITNTGTAGYAIYANTSGNIVFGIKDDTAWGASSPTTPSPDDTATSTTDIYDGTWHHIVATKTGTSRIDLYVDGKLNASDTTLAATATLANAIALRVGDDDADATNSFAGDLDEIKIFRSAATEDQVRILYNASSIAAYSTLSGPTQEEADVAGSAGNAPIAWLTFDEGTDNTCPGGADDVCDKSGNSNDGLKVNMSSTNWTSGKYGKALNFDNTDDTLSLNTNLGISASSFTVEGWIKRNSTGSLDLLVGNAAFADNTALWFHFTSSNTLTCDFFNNATTSTETFTDTTQFHHVACTYDAGTNDRRIYYDGRLVASGTASADTTLSTDLTLGDRDELGNDQPCDCLIDEFKAYNYVRTPAQVAYDFNRGRPVAWWQMDECSGGTINDNSVTNTNNGTLSGATAPNTGNGTCTTVDTATKWYNGRTGKFNASLDFDDVDDIATITDNDSLDLTGGLSISAWVNISANEADNVIISKGTSYELGTDASGNVYWDGAGAQVDDNSGRVATGSWQHIVVTNDDTTATYYVNGVSTGTDAAGIDIDNATNLIIGGDGTNFFDGQIDDVRIYNYVLSATQVRKLYDYDAGARFGPAQGSP